MPINRHSLSEHIAQAPHELICEVLTQAKIDHDPKNTTVELAELLTKKLWWKAHTPIGYQIAQHTLESILAIYAQKLDIQLEGEGGWTQLKSLTDQLVPIDTDISFENLPEDLRDRLRSSAWKTVTGAGGTATAAGSRWAAVRILGAMTGPIWQWLRFVPKLGPVLIGVRTAAGWVATLSGPIAVASAIYTVNQALGPRWDDALPLLLGIGLIQRHNSQLANIPN